MVVQEHPLSHLRSDRRSARARRRERSLERRERDEHDLEKAVRAANLPQPAEQYVEYRVLPFARFCENQANSSRLAYYWLRIPAITLAAIVPALVAANLGTGARWVATCLGVIVAATTATEHFLNVGARWRHYRSTVETLKSETWSFLRLAGTYEPCKSYEGALQPFVRQTEHMIRVESAQYVSLIDSDNGTSSHTAQSHQDKSE